MRNAPPAHYVRHNRVTRVPRNFIIFDTEARRVPNARGETQVFRLAVAARDRRRHDDGTWGPREWGEFTAPADLWEWIDARCQARARTVAVAHNLAYDLRVGGAFVTLPALGWTLTRIAFSHGRAWCSWRKDGKTLVLCDSMSWAPVALERLGEMVECPKLALPDWHDDDAAWFARCRRDVEILATVWRRLMDWVRDDDLGNFKPTGAGQAWAAYRHRFMGHKLLAHDDVRARAAERRAAWTGRCEVWHHGVAHGGPFAEWDMASAHATIGAECDVPTILAGQTSRGTFDGWRKLTRRYAVLAEVTVTTETPTVPALVDGRIAWPVGTFATTLWENELGLALEHGATVEFGALRWYRRAPALASFCRWVLAHLDDRAGRLDPVIVCAAKHWGRALIGRFGARWSDWESVGVAPELDVGLYSVLDQTEGARWSMLQVGYECKRETDTIDSADAVVSVMSWVMAECRVRLWRLCELVGAEHVVYMDTDGIITTAAGSQRLREAALPGVRCKGEWSALELVAPRQIVTSGRLRASGVPRGSVQVAPGVWEGDVWAELGTSLRNGQPSSVEIATRRIRLTGKDARREHLPGGATAPRRVELAP